MRKNARDVAPAEHLLILQRTRSPKRQAALDNGPLVAVRSRGFSAVLLGLITFTLHSATAEEARPSPGFYFCATPNTPRCVENSEKAKPRGGCEEEVQNYIKFVFRYRECLALEMERAVRESNDLIDDWKCRKNTSACRAEKPRP